MSKTDRHVKCEDCNGLGYIKTLRNSYVECIICNSSGITTHGSNSEAEKTLLYKITLDYLDGRQKGWYH